MDNSYIKAQCRNMISVLDAFSTACELAAHEDDGAISKEELRQLRKIRAAAARFQAELQRVAEKHPVPAAKRHFTGVQAAVPERPCGIRSIPKRISGITGL